MNFQFSIVNFQKFQKNPDRGRIENWKLPAGRPGRKIETFRKGFTLLETVVALALIVSAAIGPISLAILGTNRIQIARSRLVALNLSQEGLELVRHMREGNILYGYDWRGNAGLTCPGDETCMPCGAYCARLQDLASVPGYQIDMFTNVSQSLSGNTPPPHSDQVLYYYDNGTIALYAAPGISFSGASTASPFKRMIMLETQEGDRDKMLVTSRVDWNQNGIERSVTLTEVLMNWQ